MEKLPKIAQKSPYLIDEKAGKKAFCTCGLSSKNPYCDGSHKGTGFSPKIIEEKFTELGLECKIINNDCYFTEDVILGKIIEIKKDDEKVYISYEKSI